MSKHTSGPWLIEKQFGTGGVDCGLEVLQKRAEDDFNYRGPVCRINDAEHIKGITKSECDANARLISAAPELLEALQYLLDNQGDYSAEGVERCRAAILKATGEQA